MDVDALKSEIKTELKSEILSELRSEFGEREDSSAMNSDDSVDTQDVIEEVDTSESQSINGEGDETLTISDTVTQEASVESVYGYTFNYTSDWSDVSGQLNPDAEFEFALGQWSAYAMIISEEIEVWSQLLRDTVLENIELWWGSDIEILEEETIIHDGREVLSLQVKANIQGTVFVYWYYIYSGDEWSLQVITFTWWNLFEKYKSDLETFLKGLAF